MILILLIINKSKEKKYILPQYLEKKKIQVH